VRARYLTALLVGVALTFSLAACKGEPSTAQPAPAVSSSVATTTEQTTPTPASPASSSAVPGASAAARQSSALAGVTNDLQGIASANGQASSDLDAGDNARSQNDNG
jgi:hypothetical protein